MTDPLLIVSIAFAALYFIMVIYYFVGWLRLKKEVGTTNELSGQNEASSATLPFVSVVIPVRNESTHIQACLESILKQTYPSKLFEIVVIDDYSTDPTLRLAREVNAGNISVFDLQQYLGNPGEYSPNKKKAIALGIKNAKGELIITTDGDCVMGENWLMSMVSCYRSHGYKLLTGPVMIKPARNPFAWFQQLDVMSLIGITGATIRNNFPNMCNGANLMYAKETFLAVEGFKGNHDVPTGDDIFLMHKVNERFPGTIGFAKNFEACVFTKAEKGLGGFISQRVRWISKTTRFGPGHPGGSNLKIKTVLFFAYCFNALIVLNAFYLLQPAEMNWLPLAVVGGTKLFADLLFNIPLTIFFRKIVLLLLLPLIDVFHVLYVVLIGLLGLIGRYRWKDRLVK